MDEMAQNYQASNGYQQMAPPPTTGYSQMPSYGSSQGQYQNQFAPPPAPVMQPPQTPYSHQSHHTNYQSQSNMHMGQSYGYMSNQQSYQQPHYEQPAPIRQEPTVDYQQPSADYRRSSTAQNSQPYPAPSQMIPPFNPMDQYNRSQSMSQPIQPLQSPNHTNPPVSTPTSMRIPKGHALAPLKTLQPPATEKLEPVSPSYQSPPSSMPAPLSATSDSTQGHGYIDATRPPLAKYVPQPIVGQKRAFSASFDTQHLNERLTQGARPNVSAPYGYDSNYEEADMEEPMDRAAMSYRRADGTHRQRRVPDLIS
jgi:hypothetical protein